MWSMKNKKRKFTLYPCKKSNFFHAKKVIFYISDDKLHYFFNE